MKTKFKFLIILLFLVILSYTPFCFATSSDDIMLISTNDSESITSQPKENTRSDLYITDNEYKINNIVEGNVFASVDTLDIVPQSNGGIITGNVFATANSVNIKSDITYSENEKDELGNPTISVNNITSIYGNVFIMADKFVLEPGSEINGDLYVCANKIVLGQNSIVYGNIFAIGNDMDLNCQVGGDLYANTKNFDMKYYGFIRRDLHLNSQNASINGYVYRNSFISSDNIILDDKFINEENFNVENANKLTFSGEVKGNASINCKEITFDTNKSNCIIKGNLNYSSKERLNLEDGVVLKEINYSEYKSFKTNNILSNIWNYILNLLTSLACSYVIYLLLSKVTPNFADKLADLTWISLLKALGIGLGFLILIPILSILLLISNVGSILGLIVLLIYIILVIIAKPIFIISIATFAKNRISDKLNIYLYILGITLILSLIYLIPYLGFAISMLATLIGLGIVAKNLIPIKK